MHGFGPALFFAPLFLFGGLLKVLLIVGLIMLIVRLAGGPRRYHPAYAHGHHHGHWAPMGDDPRRVAAMRYASGQIGREEFDAIMRTLDGTQPPAA